MPGSKARAFPKGFLPVIYSGLFIALLLLQLRLWVGTNSRSEVAILQQRIAEQQASNAQMKQRNQELMARVQDLRSGTDALEEVARSQLGLIKEGEQFYLMVDQP